MRFAFRTLVRDALGGVHLLRREHLPLDLLDVAVERLGDRPVVIHDPIDDRIERRARPAAHDLGPLLGPHARFVEVCLAVAHGDDEAGAEEDQHLAVLDGLVGLDPAGGLQDDEQRVAVDLELRPLVRDDRILDGQVVQLELAPDGVELLLGRLVHPDPDEGVVGPARLPGVSDLERARLPAALLIDGAVDDHGCEVSRNSRPTRRSRKSRIGATARLRGRDSDTNWR